MSNKFERLLDHLVNEDMEKANALFHEIVVEKSRSIYESLMADSLEEEDELYQEDMEEMEEGTYDLAERFPGGDPADKFVGRVVNPDAMDMEDDNFGDMDLGDMDDMDADDMEVDADEFGAEEMDGGEELEDTVHEIQDTLEELKAEFEELLAKMGGDSEDDEFGDDDEDDTMDMDMDMDMDAGDEDEDAEEEESDEEMIREYREIISKDPFTGVKEQGAHTRSPVNVNAKNRPSGGDVSAHNIAQGSVEGSVKKAKVAGEKMAKGMINVDGMETDGYKRKAAGSKKEAGVNAKDVLP